MHYNFLAISPAGRKGIFFSFTSMKNYFLSPRVWCHFLLWELQNICKFNSALPFLYITWWSCSRSKIYIVFSVLILFGILYLTLVILLYSLTQVNPWRTPHRLQRLLQKHEDVRRAVPAQAGKDPSSQVFWLQEWWKVVKNGG